MDNETAVFLTRSLLVALTKIGVEGRKNEMRHNEDRPDIDTNDSIGEQRKVKYITALNLCDFADIKLGNGKNKINKRERVKLIRQFRGQSFSRTGF